MIHIFTYAEGVLSAVAHDLLLQTEEVRVSVTQDQVEVTVDARSLRVAHAVKHGQPAPVPAGDRAEIEKSARDEVLEVRRYPEIRFTGRASSPDAAGERAVNGTLTLHGVSRPLSLRAREADGFWTGAIAALDQREFRITPYRAMLGALKVKPHVRIVFRIPVQSTQEKRSCVG
ncbi:MAG: YceI family protein [Myxococcaceae bacterium]